MIHRSHLEDRAEPDLPDYLIFAWWSDHEGQVEDIEGGAAKSPVWLIRALLFLILCVCIASLGVAQVNQETGLFSEKVVYLVGVGTSGPYRLKDHHIVLETETIRKRGFSLRRDQDYSIDYNSGQVTFSAPIYDTDTLEVSYQKLNLNLKKRYFHRELVLGNSQVHRGEPSSSARKAENATLETRKWGFLPQKGSSELALSGSKTFSFELGSAQDQLDGGLDLLVAVAARLADDHIVGLALVHGQPRLVQGLV